MAPRNDPHCPSNFSHNDYDLVTIFALSRTREGEFIPSFNIDEVVRLRAENTFFDRYGDGDTGTNRCDICGAWFIEGAVLHHVPSDTLITIGHTCADKFEFDADFRPCSIFAKAEAGKARWRSRIRSNVASVRSLLKAEPKLAKALTCKHYITRDLVRGLLKNGSLSDKQVELAFKLQADQARYDERDARDARTNWVPVPETDKRIEIEGEIVHTKLVDNDYGSTLKCLILVGNDDACFKLWGTVPSAIENQLNAEYRAAEDALHAKEQRTDWAEVERVGGEAAVNAAVAVRRQEYNDLKRRPLTGLRIKFVARVERSKDDESFGFYKRPTKPVLQEVN